MWACAALAALASVGTPGCGGGGNPPPVNSCPNDVPATCPLPAPSYSADVAPVVATRCTGCHTANGIEAIHPLDTYAQAQAQGIRILSQVHACLMPPADQPQLTPTERQSILAWVVCGSPDN